VLQSILKPVKIKVGVDGIEIKSCPKPEGQVLFIFGRVTIVFSYGIKSVLISSQTGHRLCWVVYPEYFD